MQGKPIQVQEYGEVFQRPDKHDLREHESVVKEIHKDIEKEMKRIADNIFGYNPKIDPRDPLFRKTLSWSVKKEGKGKKNEKND